MPKIADALERESRTVDLEQGDFERLLGRRERKERNRKIRAGAVGVTVALVMGIFLVRSMMTSDRVPADRPVEPRPVPAASGTLAYALDGDIYVADADGSNSVKIADGRPFDECGDGIPEYWAEGPMWSPDGRYLAYRYSDCASSEWRGGVVISDAEGNVVASFPADGWGIGWSPDSTRVAVWDVVFETIGVYGLDGARQTQLTMPAGHGGSGDHDPVWMPDGTSLMVPNGSRIELPLDGGAPRPLRWDRAAYSPDGSQVVYTDHVSLMVARSDGSGSREVFGGGAWNAAWSPNGERIAFTTSGDVRRIDELQVVDVATGSATTLTEGERGTTLFVIGFSPQGGRILFSRTDDGTGEGSLWSIGVDGSDARLVVAGTWQGEWFSPS
jgi:dipeptidyl aminopeptidase/acylaminoacyl peptidase